MSTFTNWNGPQGSGPAASDWRELIQNYKDAITALGNKQDKLTWDNEPIIGSLNPVTSNGIANVTQALQNAITAINNVLGNKAEVSALNQKANRDELANFVTQAAVDNAITTALGPYCKTNTVQQIQAELIAEIARINNAVEAEPFVKTEIRADLFYGLVHATEQIQFTDKRYSAFVGGTDIRGVYYILGMLCDKAGTAYIRMGNTKPFSAAVNFAVTPGWKGALSVTTDCELKGLVFKIVYGTDADGNAHAYLAIQSSEWFSQFASSDGVGLYSDIEFFGAGINFIPVSSAGWKRPNGACHNVCDCKSGKGFSFSELASVIMGKQIYREEGNPYVTVNDLKALDHVGVISQWTDYDDNGIAINVPEGYHACDGTEVLPEDDVSDEFRAKYTEYPLMDYSIIKTKSTIEVEQQEDTDYSLAEAVCTLHGIKFYTSITELPDEAKVGEPVIVAAGDKYAVYVYNDPDGWQKYSTTFNDINSTIGAVAAVIAAEHGADVYTIYNSAADLPTGPSVETGALAIVFDGNYSVFKYNGTAWELQV